MIIVIVCLLIFGGDWPTTVLSVWSMICLVGKEEHLNGDDPCCVLYICNFHICHGTQLTNTNYENKSQLRRQSTNLNGDDPSLIIFYQCLANNDYHDVRYWSMMIQANKIGTEWKLISCPLLFLRSSGEIGVAGKKGQFLVCRTNWVSSFLLSSPSAPGLISSTVRNKVPKFQISQNIQIQNITCLISSTVHIKVPKFQR